ncbi:helix-turn-helix domain-containing protein [Bacillus sp. FJAT-45037]|uniref:helix-turn-helix domain-containing protein n=1 Tax=Bacillus sp. FJAT-45037 TaxID=2011007 RepID=UPI000C249C9C|nr:helix-turn-helix transcriptional regulator [Bacillus sp. FJAT-45037]
MNSSKYIAEKLKRGREKKQLNQSELARILNVSAVTISRYEKGHAVPPIDLAFKLSEILEINLNEIVPNYNFFKSLEIDGWIMELATADFQTREKMRKIWEGMRIQQSLKDYY